MTEAASQWEWMIILLLVLGVLVWELFSIRRSIRRAKQDSRPADRPP